MVPAPSSVRNHLGIFSHLAAFLRLSFLFQEMELIHPDSQDYGYEMGSRGQHWSRLVLSGDFSTPRGM